MGGLYIGLAISAFAIFLLPVCRYSYYPDEPLIENIVVGMLSVLLTGMLAAAWPVSLPVGAVMYFCKPEKK